LLQWFDLYQAPRYYSELKDKDKNSKLFPTLAAISYGTAALIYIGTMILGLALFGSKGQSFALNSFSAKDPLGTFARIAFGTSVLASYPLIFISIRSFFVKKLSRKIPMIAGTKRVTLLLLTFIGSLAVVCRDIGLVGSLSGGVFGSSMMFIFPPIMYSYAIWKQAADQNKPAPLRKIFFNGISMILGASLGLLGTIKAIISYQT
jgi:hypothetical protein